MLSLMMIGKKVDGSEAITPSNRIVQGEPFSSKQEMEIAHLAHFLSLAAQKQKKINASFYNFGDDPPDFIINRNGHLIGLELTALAEEKRRSSAFLIGKWLHDKLIEKYDDGHLRNLEGITIRVTFSNKNLPKNLTCEEIDELVNQLDGLKSIVRIPFTDDWISTPGQPPQFVSGCISNGKVEWVVTGISQSRLFGSKLANHTGFEIEYDQLSTYDINDIVEMINKRIEAKDKDNGTSELLISVGAPDLQGKSHIAEALYVSYVMKHAGNIFHKPNHLKKVYMDIWWADEIIIIHDDFSDCGSPRRYD